MTKSNRIGEIGEAVFDSHPPSVVTRTRSTPFVASSVRSLSGHRGRVPRDSRLRPPASSVADATALTVAGFLELRDRVLDPVIRATGGKVVGRLGAESFGLDDPVGRLVLELAQARRARGRDGAVALGARLGELAEYWADRG